MSTSAQETPLFKTPIMIAALSLVATILIIIVVVNVSHSDSSSSVPSTPQYSSQDNYFLNTVNQRTELAQYPNSQLITFGHQVCTDRSEGYSDSMVETAIQQGAGITPYNSGWLVGAGEKAYCPAEY